jgi:hypothetical protein
MCDHVWQKLYAITIRCMKCGEIRLNYGESTNGSVVFREDDPIFDLEN